MSSSFDRKRTPPYRADQIKPGQPYELSQGRLIRCDPAGGRHTNANLVGAQVLATDPKVTSAGIDTGFSPAPDMLRAPDIAIGNVPNEPGWVSGVPPLAVEYADVEQDEKELQKKIEDFLHYGTQHVWIVRLNGPRRVEIYEPGKSVRIATPGDVIEAPDVFQNPVRVEELYDPEAAMAAQLRNLLQRQGYASGTLDEVRKASFERGIEQGIERAVRNSLRDMCELVGIAWTSERAALVEQMNAPQLDALREAIKLNRTWPEEKP